MTNYHEDELKKAFDNFDRDGNGTIDKDEFEELMESLAEDVTDEEIEIGFSVIDKNHNNKIDFDEFVSWWTER